MQGGVSDAFGLHHLTTFYNPLPTPYSLLLTSSASSSRSDSAMARPVGMVTMQNSVMSSSCSSAWEGWWDVW